MTTPTTPAEPNHDGRDAPITAGVPIDHEEEPWLPFMVERQLVAGGEREVGSRSIGESVMRELRDLDQVAYVRFASVYRSFQDVNAFREEIERLESEPSAESRRQQLPLLPKT